MHALARRLTPLALLLALAGCGSKPATDTPLAFVPANTPYVVANLDGMPQAVLDQWAAMTRDALPVSLGIYQRALDKAGNADSTEIKAARAVLDEMAQTLGKGGDLKALGFSGQAHAALYGVGLLPVLRIELADPAALRAAVARIEAKAGAKLPTAKLGDVEYWTIALDKAVALFAVSERHFVLALAPAQASEDLRKQLLGVTPPRAALDPAKLEQLNRQYGYLPYGSGYVDLVRLTEFLSDDADPQRRELAAALGAPVPKPLDATCRSELLALAAKFPRLSMGYTELAPKRMAFTGRLELDAGLAKDFAAAWAGAPGTATPAEGLFDLSLSLPLLKQKSFWLKQANAVATQPWSCAELNGLNQGFAQIKQSLGNTIPPPASDLTGARVVVSRLGVSADKPIPDFSGKVLLGLTNPAGALAMAQLTVAPLKDFKLAPDAKPVALPAELATVVEAPHAAMTDKALAVSAGQGEEATLPAFLAAAPSAQAQFFRLHFSGDLYGQLGAMVDRFAAFLPAEQQADLDSQKQLFAIYQRTIRSVEIGLLADGSGVAFQEAVELK